MRLNDVLLDPYERLVPIHIEGRTVEVPDRNTVLRVLQALEFDLYPCRLCWNGDCDNCRILYLDPATASPHSDKACQMDVFEGLRILAIPKQARWPDAPDL